MKLFLSQMKYSEVHYYLWCTFVFWYIWHSEAGVSKQYMLMSPHSRDHTNELCKFQLSYCHLVLKAQSNIHQC